MLWYKNWKNTKKKIEIEIQKGMHDGENFIFESEGDEEPNITPGDVIFIIKQKQHDIFQRKGNDLWIKT